LLYFFTSLQYRLQRGLGSDVAGRQIELFPKRITALQGVFFLNLGVGGRETACFTYHQQMFFLNFLASFGMDVLGEILHIGEGILLESLGWGFLLAIGVVAYLRREK